jgi:hypothetical protein
VVERVAAGGPGIAYREGKPMRIEAILSRQDIADLLQAFVPLQLELGEPSTGERTVIVDALGEVILVPDIGVRVTCAGRMRWPVLGIHLPVHVRLLTLMLAPRVEAREGSDNLVWRLTLEDADIAWLPAKMDREIIEKVNRELSQHHTELAWNFTDTLTHEFLMPAALQSAKGLGLRVTGGSVGITEAAVSLAVAFSAAVTPRSAASTPTLAPTEPDAGP